MNWQTKKLSEICDFQNGFAFKSETFKKKGSPVLRISNIQNDGISYSRLVYFNKNDYRENFDKYQVNKGDLVIAMSGATTGKIAISDAKEMFYLNQRVGKFIPKKDLLNDYLYYFLSTKIEENLRISSGAAQPNLSTEQIKDFKIPLPSLSEQLRIVKILDEAFESIAKAKSIAEKNLQNSRDVFDSFLETVFTKLIENWEKGKLVNLFQIKPPKKEASEKLVNDDFVSFVPMEDLRIRYKEFTCNKERRLKEVSGSYTYFANDDVLLAKITPCFENGKLGIARNLKNGIGFGSSEYIVFRSNGKVVPDYLYYFLAREQFRKQGSERMLGAVGHKRVSKEYIEDSVIQFPKSTTEQKFVVAKLDKLSIEIIKLESIYQQKLADLDELKKSILNKAFNGEL